MVLTDVPEYLMGGLLENGIACLQNSVTGESILPESAIPSPPGTATSSRRGHLRQGGYGVSSQVHIGAVRSGQQIYAQGRSLVVIGNVNSGAEVMADGDVYVFGRLMGRAVAGIGTGQSSDGATLTHLYTSTHSQ